MKLIPKKLSFLLESRAISIAVLVGFLCIQFHSFSHIDFSSIDIEHGIQKTENVLNKLDNQSPEEHDITIECPDCVLAKHIQTDALQSETLQADRSSKILLVSQTKSISYSAYPSHHLRAPPLVTV